MMFLGKKTEDCISMFHIKRLRIGNSLFNILVSIYYMTYFLLISINISLRFAKSELLRTSH